MEIWHNSCHGIGDLNSERCPRNRFLEKSRIEPRFLLSSMKEMSLPLKRFGLQDNEEDRGHAWNWRCGANCIFHLKAALSKANFNSIIFH
ncbi:hypothetical protein [Paenibacillus sp. D51F]